MKRALLILGMLIAVFVTAVATLDLSRFSPLFEEWAIAQAAKNNVHLSFGKTHPRLIGIECFDVNALIVLKRLGFLSLTVDSIDISSNLLDVALLQPSASIAATLYKGSLNGLVQGTLRGYPLRGSASLSNLRLEQHQQLAGFGIQSGSLSGSLEQFVWNQQNQPATGTFQLRVKDLAKPQPSKLSLEPFGMPFNLDIPAVTGVQAFLKGEAKADSVVVEDFNFSSSLGSGEGDGLIKLNARGSAIDITGKLDLHLSDAGVKLLGPYLPLVSQGSLSSTVNHFRLRISGPPARPQITWRGL